MPILLYEVVESPGENKSPKYNDTATCEVATLKILNPRAKTLLRMISIKQTSVYGAFSMIKESALNFDVKES